MTLKLKFQKEGPRVAPGPKKRVKQRKVRAHLRALLEYPEGYRKQLATLSLPPSRAEAEQFLTKGVAKMIAAAVDAHEIVAFAARLRERVFLELIRAADPSPGTPASNVIDLQKEAAYRALAKELASKVLVKTPTTPTTDGSVDQ